jgi:hypothetical protein
MNSRTIVLVLLHLKCNDEAWHITIYMHLTSTGGNIHFRIQFFSPVLRHEVSHYWESFQFWNSSTTVCSDDDENGLLTSRKKASPFLMILEVVPRALPPVIYAASRLYPVTIEVVGGMGWPDSSTHSSGQIWLPAISVSLECWRRNSMELEGVYRDRDLDTVITHLRCENKIKSWNLLKTQVLRFNLLRSNGNNGSSTFCPQCIFMFRMILRGNSYYFEDGCLLGCSAV